ncbi:MAG: molecular chaperone TorD family protein [Raoultibacter sp.]
MDEQELQDVMDDRMFAYRFLAQAFRAAPTTSFLQALKDSDMVDDALLGDFIVSLRTADLEALKTDLGAEYARVLLNMSAHPVPPFESVYSSPEKLLMQDARDEVVAAYQSEGLGVVEDFREPEDHVATEFEFMAYLCEKASAALATGDEQAVVHYQKAQCDFFQHHLASWVPAFCDDFEKQVTTLYYRGICALTRQQIAMDADFLASVSR